MNSSPSTDELAKILWDYNHLEMPLQKSTAILVLGSHDLRVAQHGANLFLQGCAPLLIFSGGYGRLTQHLFQQPEAHVFAEVALRMGVPAERILVEDRSTNTGENIQFTRQLLQQRGLEISSFILVQKPYMLRRTYATFKMQWPDKAFLVSGPPIPYEDYPNETISREALINILVGDTQRIQVYPQKGFQVYQEIPAEVWLAFRELVARGYTAHLIPGSPV